MQHAAEAERIIAQARHRDANVLYALVPRDPGALPK
jgi:hypothetical protein